MSDVGPITKLSFANFYVFSIAMGTYIPNIDMSFIFLGPYALNILLSTTVTTICKASRNFTLSYPVTPLLSEPPIILLRRGKADKHKPSYLWYLLDNMYLRPLRASPALVRGCK